MRYEARRPRNGRDVSFYWGNMLAYVEARFHWGEVELRRIRNKEEWDGERSAPIL